MKSTAEINKHDLETPKGEFYFLRRPWGQIQSSDVEQPLGDWFVT